MPRFLELIPIPKDENPRQFLTKTLKENPIVFQGTKGTYQLLAYLGGGTYGDVFSALSDGQEFALKITPNNAENWREAEAYARLQACGSYVACTYEILDYMTPNGQKWIIFVQQLFQQDLHYYKAKPEEISSMLLDLLTGLACIHGQNLAHLDVKSANMFTAETERGRIYKIGDPGLLCAKNNNNIRFVPLNTCTFLGTYAPPDLLDTLRLGQSLTLKEAQSMDIWNLGLFFLGELWLMGYQNPNLRPYFNAIITHAENGSYIRGSIDQNKSILPDLKSTKDGTFGQISNRVLLNILGQMTQWNTNSRPNAEQLLIGIVRQMNWAPPGQELYYLNSKLRRESCESQLPKPRPSPASKSLAEPITIPQIMQPKTYKVNKPLVGTRARITPRRILK